MNKARGLGRIGACACDLEKAQPSKGRMLWYPTPPSSYYASVRWHIF